MTKWIRWQGAAAFVIIVALLAVVWWLLIDRLIQRGIEQAGTAALGARVELDAADLTLFPLGLTLTGLQVTNPEEPMTNALEIRRIAGGIDALNLLRRKLIVEELAVEGVRLGTARKTSGALPGTPPGAAKAAGGGTFALPGASLRDPQEILAAEKLQTLQIAEALQKEIAAEKERWQKNLAALPDEAKLREYQKRLETLRGAGQGGVGAVLGGIGEAARLQEEIRGDLARLRSARKDLEGSSAALRRRFAEAGRAPAADLQRLMDKYSLSGQGLTNLSAALLGGQIGQWLRKGLAWRAKIEPLLARAPQRDQGADVVKPLRGQGVNVRFPERRPLPDLLIRKTRLTADIAAGRLSGQILNITSDQPVLGKPLTFQLAGEKLQDIGGIALNGEINRLDPARPLDRGELKITQARLTDYPLGEPEGPGILIREALADIDVAAALGGRNISATLTARLRSLRTASAAKADAGAFAAAIIGALAEVKGFQVAAKIDGPLDNYAVQLTSDLDQVLRYAVGRQVQAQADKLREGLQAAIADRVKGPLGGLTGELGGLDTLTKELTGRLNLGEDLLKAGAGARPGLRLPF